MVTGPIEPLVVGTAPAAIGLSEDEARRRAERGQANQMLDRAAAACVT
jgi:hypothetical protein